MGNFNLGFPVSLKKPLFLIPSVQSEKKQGNIIVQTTEEKGSTGQEMPSGVKDSLRCKFCGEFIHGNRGNLLAHVRQCDKRG